MVFMFAIMNDLPNACLAEAISYLISYHPHGKALRCSPKQWHFKREGTPARETDAHPFPSIP